MGSYLQPPQSIIIWDTEYTCWPNSMPRNYNGPGQHREVFQIAALKWQKGQPWQQAETLMVMPKPVINPILSPYAQQLTGVTQQQMEEQGVTTAEALAQLSAFVGDAICWSNGNDINPLAETCGLQKVVMPLNVANFHTLHHALHAALHAEVGEFETRDYPSGNVYKLLNLTLPTSQTHNALHDVYSLAATVEELERRGHNLGLWDKA